VLPNMSAEERPAKQFVHDVALAYGSALHRFLVQRMRAGSEASDMAQEVYLRLLRIEKPELIRQPLAYIYYVAAQVAGQFGLRAKDRAQLHEEVALDRVASAGDYTRTDELPDREHAERELMRVLSKLSVAHRTVLLMKKQEGFTNAEVAAKLNIPRRRVKEMFVEANLQLLEGLVRPQGKDPRR
jgi:RNA polymerase sigma-70 factor (ECF subfamily)